MVMYSVLEAAEPAERESPRSTLDAVPVDIDTRSEMAGAEAFAIEEAHDGGCGFGTCLRYV
jgi:hypothetical protein